MNTQRKTSDKKKEDNMNRIRIEDLPKHRRMSRSEMHHITGGGCSEGQVIMKGLGCVDAGHLSGLKERNSRPNNRVTIITDKIYDKLNNHTVMFA